jgi:hypothetical protein
MMNQQLGIVDRGDPPASDSEVDDIHYLHKKLLRSVTNVFGHGMWSNKALELYDLCSLRNIAEEA